MKTSLRWLILAGAAIIGGLLVGCGGGGDDLGVPSPDTPDKHIAATAVTAADNAASAALAGK